MDATLGTSKPQGPHTLPTDAMLMPLGWMLCLATLAIAGTIGNIFIMGAVCLSQRLRIHGNVFVVNLAFADLLITAYIMPVGLVASQYNVQPFNGALCDFNAFLISTSCGVSINSLVMIAVERYVHICKPHWYRRVYHKYSMPVFVVFTWLYTTAWTVQGWTGWTRFIYGENVFSCIFDGRASLSYDLCVTGFGWLIPMCILIFCYLRVFQTVKRSGKALRAHARELGNPLTVAEQQHHKQIQLEHRMIVTLFSIVVTFILLWTPAALVLSLTSIWDTMPPVLFTTSTWLAFSNSSTNSFLYGVLNRNFRNGYTIFFSKLFCVEQCRQHCSHDPSELTERQPSRRSSSVETRSSQRSRSREGQMSTRDPSNLHTTQTTSSVQETENIDITIAIDGESSVV